MSPFLTDLWPVVLSVTNIGLAVVATGHVILRKRDVRAAVGWVGLIWLAPFIGVAAYILLGINRIRRRGLRLAPARDSYRERLEPGARAPEEGLAAAAERHPACVRLARLIGRLTGRPLVAGNRVTPLVSGEAAYPAMLAAIDDARHSVTLGTYIFDNDPAGHAFVERLAAAVERGVAVRVLVDDVGAYYSRPTILSVLRSRGIPCASFLPTRTPRVFNYANLRNHRKVLVVDGTVSFTGGMNIRDECRLDWNPPYPTLDLHFRLDGPVVGQLQEVFAVDWAFTTDEVLEDERWFPTLETQGQTYARAISDGPDEDFDKLRLTLLGALSVARQHVCIVTPYFLPDPSIIAALAVAALRGVQVDVVLPARGNIRIVDWATRALLWQVLEHGCRVWLTPPPFDHTKLFLVDEEWALLGSTNWDARSLRLNFELNVECYDHDLSRQLRRHADDKIRAARELTRSELDRRPLPAKLRDAVARLLSPYL